MTATSFVESSLGLDEVVCRGWIPGGWRDPGRGAARRTDRADRKVAGRGLHRPGTQEEESNLERITRTPVASTGRLRGEVRHAGPGIGTPTGLLVSPQKRVTGRGQDRHRISRCAIRNAIPPFGGQVQG